MANGDNGFVVVRDEHGSRYWADALTMPDHLAVDWVVSYAHITDEMIEWMRSRCTDAVRSAMHEWWQYSQRVNTPSVATVPCRHTWGIHPGSVYYRDGYAVSKCASEIVKAISGDVCVLDIGSVLEHGVSDTYSFGTAASAEADLRGMGAIKTTWVYLDDMRLNRRFACLVGTAPQDKPLQYYMDGEHEVRVWGDVTPESMDRRRKAVDGGDWLNDPLADDAYIHFGVNYKLAVWVRRGTRMLVVLEVK